MRPKIVVFILVAAIAIIALAAVLKGTLQGHGDKEAIAPLPPPVEPSPPPATTPPVAVNPTTNAAVLEELRAAEVVKELDQIRDLQADGTVNPATTSILLTKVTHREPEVRKAALEALVQLNDTNAVPGLEQAQALAEDPHEKVALMDAVAYLKLPSAIPAGMAEPQDETTARPRVAGPTGGRSKRASRNQGQRGAPAPAPGAAPTDPNKTQPVQTAPDAAPPQ